MYTYTLSFQCSAIIVLIVNFVDNNRGWLKLIDRFRIVFKCKVQ